MTKHLTPIVPISWGELIDKISILEIKKINIKSEVSVTGVGLHTGKVSKMTFKPAADNHGYKFKRMDNKKWRCYKERI